MDNDLYIRAAHRQLHQITVYKILDFDIDRTEDIIPEIIFTLNRLVILGVITQDIANYANLGDSKPIFSSNFRDHQRLFLRQYNR